ncbi:MAG: hypothetical protein JWO05_972 [Gemmatimonadetes bacterium]|nr:hypothetical protein [Gemmatimonadota bacterium]
MSKHPTPVDPLFLSFQLALAGRYSIDRELGRGGMGVVYLAREVHLDRLVAIKLLPPERADEQLRQRFLREARLAAKLSHPNIIPIHAVDEVAGFVYYVMAFVDGETLAERVRDRGPLPASEGARVLREAAWALAHAHAQGLVHRDVKPDNILLEANSGRVLVADFGIAATLGDDAGGVAGTPEFMSPEQALGQPIDARSDIYSLGISAFYALSGRLPFQGDSATEVLAKQVTEPAPQLSALGVPVPRKLELIVDRCLAKSPDDRPAHATALADLLTSALEQRRELPLALRVFVKRAGRMDGSGTLVTTTLVAVGAVAVGAVSGNPSTGFVSAGVAALVLPATYMVVSARQLLRKGFAHQDLTPAFKSEMETSTEELTLGRHITTSKLEPVLAFIAKVSGTFAVLGFTGIVLSDAFPVLRELSSLGVNVALAWGVATVSSMTHLFLTQRHRDVDTAFWQRIWMGPIGRGAFAVARRLVGRRTTPIAMTHRATELSLGLAAEQLYESLPRAQRQALGALPGVLHRLQEHAQQLRKAYDGMQEVLGQAGGAGATEEYAGLRTDRDRVHGKMTEAVGALETIRLNLLRLHAGSLTVEGLTTHLGIAADVAAEVERMVSARQEVERALQFPRRIAATPA